MSWYNGKRYQQRSSKLRAQHLHEKNVKTAQQNTLKREAAEGEAYAKKMQADYERGKKAVASRDVLKKAFSQKTR